MIGSQSIKELQAVCGRMDLIRIYDKHKLSFWSCVNGLENVVLQACYGSLSGTKEFTFLTYHYDVVIAKSAPHDMKNNITNSFINTIFLM